MQREWVRRLSVLEAIPGQATTPTGQGYLTAAQRGKRAAAAHKKPRRVPRQNMPSTPSDAGSRKRSSASGGSSSRQSGGSGDRRSGGSGGRQSGGGRGDSNGGGGGDSNGDDDDDEDDSAPLDRSGSSRRRRLRRADWVLNDAEMQQQ